MTSIIKPIQLFLFHYRKTALAICLLLSAWMTFSAFNLKLQEDIMDLLPLEDTTLGRYADVLRIFRASDRLVFMVTLKSGDSNVDLIITAADYLAEVLQNHPFIQQVQYRWDAGDINETIGVLRPFHADFFSQKDAQQLTMWLTPESLNQMMVDWKRLLQETPAPFLSQQFKADPLGMDRLFMQKLESLATLDNMTTIEKGILFSPDRRSLLLTATPSIPSTDSLKGKQLVNDIQCIIEKATDEVSHAVDIAWLGGHRFAVDNAVFIKRDITLIASISLSMISILCLLVFKRIHYFILALLPAIFGVLAASSSIFFFRSQISAIVLGMGGVLIAIAVDYGIHVLYRVDQLKDHSFKKETLIDLVSNISTPLLLCAGTTLTAFIVLIFSSFPGYSQLGWFSVIGISAAVVFVFFILPLTITGRGSFKRRMLPIADFFKYYRHIAKKYKRTWVILSISIFLLAFPGLLHLHFDGDIEKLNMISPEVQKDWSALKATFPGVINTSFIIMRDQDKNNLFEQGEKIHEWLANHKFNASVQTAATSWLYPSKKIRQENRKRWQDFWQGDRKSLLMENLKILSKNHGIRPSFFIHAIEGLPGPMPPYDVKQVMERSLIGQILSNQLHLEDEHKLLLIPFSLKDSKKIDDFGNQVNESFPYAFVSNGSVFIKNIIQYIYHEFVKLGCLSLGAILIFIFLFSRSFTKTAGFFLPLLQALGFTFGIMGWMHIPLTIMSVLVIIFIFGLVIDYSLFLGHAAQKNVSDFSDTAGAVALSALSTLCGLGALVFAKHPALHSIGVTALLGVGSGFCFTMMNYGWIWDKNSEG